MVGVMILLSKILNSAGFAGSWNGLPVAEVSLWQKWKEKHRTVHVERKMNRRGKFLLIEVLSRGGRRSIQPPEILGGQGWIALAAKLSRFVQGSGGKKNFRSYRDVAAIPTWLDLGSTVRHGNKDKEVDLIVEDDSCKEKLRFLERCLVGRIGDLDCPIPTQSEVQR